MISQFESIIWLLFILGPFIFLQHGLHFEIQAALLIVFRKKEIALLIFYLLFFPGVLLHETSHYLAARLLRVRTGRISLIPETKDDGRIRLGFVETASSDLIRDALIGAAPLITGSLFVAYAGLVRLGFANLYQESVVISGITIINSLNRVYEQKDFWLWFYLAFAVSTTMLPSSSDRRAWIPLVLIFAILLAISLLAGAGLWLETNLWPLLDRAIHALSAVFSVSLFVHLILYIPLLIIRNLLSRIFRISVE